jgi:hypothetical protein
MKYFRCRTRREPWHSENAADEKPHLTEVFRHLPVTRRYTLTLGSAEL